MKIQSKGGESILANVEIRQNAKSSGVALWQIANELKISEATMTRMMRTELSDDMSERINGIIEKIKNKK